MLPKVKEDLNRMSTYERYKLGVDFLRFMATLAAPFVMVLVGKLAKDFLGW